MTTPGRRSPQVQGAAAFDARGFGDADDGARLVGGKAGTGAPTVGAFLVGDVVVGHDGALWVCTVAGEPGTWVGGRAVTTEGNQTVNGTKTFSSQVIAPTVRVGGPSGGVLSVNGAGGLVYTSPAGTATVIGPP